MATITVNEDMLKTAAPKNTLIVAQKDGRLYLVDFTECPHVDDPGAIDWGVSVSQMLVGKVALSRNRMSTLEQLEFENVQHTGEEPEDGAGDLDIRVFGSIDGKNNSSEVKPHLAIDEGGYVRGNCRVTATNFAIQLRGTYNVNTISVVLHPAGRR